MQKIEQKAQEKINSLFEKSGLIPCHDCKGKGKININFSLDHSIISADKETKYISHEIICISCCGRGQFDLSQKKDCILTEIYRTMWCKCGSPSESYYVDNYKCIDCINKHHYHCMYCGLITQIG